MMQGELLAARLGVAILVCAFWIEGIKLPYAALVGFLLTIFVNRYVPEQAQSTER